MRRTTQGQSTNDFGIDVWRQRPQSVLSEVAAAELWVTEFSVILRSEKLGSFWAKARTKTHGLMRSSLPDFDSEFSATYEHRAISPLIHRRSTLTLGSWGWPSNKHRSWAFQRIRASPRNSRREARGTHRAARAHGLANARRNAARNCPDSIRVISVRPRSRRIVKIRHADRRQRFAILTTRPIFDHRVDLAEIMECPATEFGIRARADPQFSPDCTWFPACPRGH